MPITLGCPSCAKRFRARDESAGKRVKCPYCQAAVPVPSPEVAHAAAAPTDVVDPAPASGLMSPPPPPRSAPLPAPPPVQPAAASEWGAGPAAAAPPAPPTTRPAIEIESEPPAPAPAPAKAGKPAKPAAAPAAGAAKTPAQLAAPGWRKTRGGLFWVLVGLFFLALLGFVPFARLVYERAFEAIPSGEGWVRIEGYLNDPATPGSFQLTKREEIELFAYGIPLVLGGLALVHGRLTCGAAPRSSGAKGAFVLSGLITLVALIGLVTSISAQKLGGTVPKGNIPKTGPTAAAPAGGKKEPVPDDLVAKVPAAGGKGAKGAGGKGQGKAQPPVAPGPAPPPAPPIEIERKPDPGVGDAAAAAGESGLDYLAHLFLRPGEPNNFAVAGAYGLLALLVGGLMAEAWFLTGLAAVGVALKRPAVVRRVALLVFVAGLMAVAATGGWEAYREYAGRPKDPKPDSDWAFYESGAMMLGWLVLIGCYWRVVTAARAAIADFLATVET